MKILVAAVQMRSEMLEISANMETADGFLREGRLNGASLAVLPEMFNTGYGLLPDFASCSEVADGPTLRHLSIRSREWKMGIVGGFVERDGRHLYDSLAICLPDGSVAVYRKRRLVFWESFRFKAGRSPLVVATPWGRIGLAVCADMMDRRIWDGYRGRIDLAVIGSAWPEFACRLSGRRSRLFGHVGDMAASIPDAVARDLDVPVVFANQSGSTRTTIPVLGLAYVIDIADRFAGCSSVCDGRKAAPVVAGLGPELVLSEVTLPEPRRATA